jgi:hypothetical protein
MSVLVVTSACVTSVLIGCVRQAQLHDNAPFVENIYKSFSKSLLVERLIEELS